MIKLIQIRYDNECLLSTQYLNDVLNYVDGLFLCRTSRENSTGVLDLNPYYIDFLVDCQFSCGVHFDMNFSLKINFKLSYIDFSRFLIDFVEPYLH